MAMAISGEKLSESRRYSRMASTFTCNGVVNLGVIQARPCTNSVRGIFRVHANLPARQNQLLSRVEQVFVSGSDHVSIRSRLSGKART